MDNGRRGASRVVTIVLLAVAAALVWVAFATVWLWRNQERVVFQPPTMDVAAPGPARRVQFQASDGHQLFGYVVSPTGESPVPRTVVMVFHGNADLAAWQVPWAR